jgi:hypothetical protein
MKKLLIVTAAFGLVATGAFAQQGNGAATGMLGGAATGAIVGGPIGAGVGAIVGAVAGSAIDPPPREVVSYVQEQPIQQSAVVQQQVVVGKPVPETVVLTPIPSNPKYAYTVVNQQRVIVEPETRRVVQVIQ